MQGPIWACFRSGDTISGELVYATDLFDESTIARLATHFCTLVAAAVAAPDTTAAELPLADAAELHLTLRTFNDTEQPYPSDKAVHQLFEQQAGCQPRAACLVTSDGKRLSYAAVNAASNQLAHWLVSRGTAAGSAVGVSLPKCPQLYIALLAVLKAGGAYVPLDPELPAERAAFMLQQADARLLLVAAAADTARLPGVEAMIVDQGWQQFADQPETNLPTASGAGRRLPTASSPPALPPSPRCAVCILLFHLCPLLLPKRVAYSLLQLQCFRSAVNVHY